jgi:hypothetical protein
MLARSAILGALLAVAIASTGAQGRPTITALSTDASLVTGGDVLVKVAFGSGMTADNLKVSVAGRDVSNAFQPAAEPGSFIGLVTGLANGKNVIDAGTKSGTRATLEVVNYPITGPVISGPWQQPFICQTNEFTLPDESKLGPPLDANCSARTIVQHVYRSTSDPKTLKPLPEGGSLPADVAKTTTSEGRKVNFIVRVETGTMNRGIYQNAVLHDPTSDPPPSPASPPKGWNRRPSRSTGRLPIGLAYPGRAPRRQHPGQPAVGGRLRAFHQHAESSTNSCNAFVAAETT